jgi:hypothetical protein
VRVKLGGYAKLDMIHDFNGMGSTDNFVVTSIPTDGSGVENTRVHARQSRLNLDARGPSQFGTVRVFFEGDFYGTSNAFRVRHAYGTVGGLLGGQTWTTFMDEDALPPTLDYNEPQAIVFERVGQLRWKRNIGEQHYAAIALEEATGSVDPGAGSGATETPWPYVTGRARRSGVWGHVQLAGFTGGLRFRPTTGNAADVFLWGLNATTRIYTKGKDHILLQAAYGHGVSAYRNGTVAAPDAQGDFKALEDAAIMASYQHHWNDRFSSNILGNYGKVTNVDGQAASALKSTIYSTINLVWHLTTKADVGIEYLYGQREDKNRANGHNNRLQVSTIVNL